MKQKIAQAVSKSKTLMEVKEAMLQLFESLKKEEGVGRIGYAAGMIFSEGPEHVEKNIKALASHTEQLRKEHDFPLFSAVDIFYEGLFNNLQEASWPYEKRRELFIAFWQDMLNAEYITDIFMTPRWELSEGARDEHETAKKRGIVIHYI